MLHLNCLQLSLHFLFGALSSWAYLEIMFFVPEHIDVASISKRT